MSKKSSSTLTIKEGVVEGLKDSMSQSELMAGLATTGALAGLTLQGYAKLDGMELGDTLAALKTSGDAVVANNLSRVERTLTNQFVVLDAMFNDLARRASHQDSFRGLEVLTRLALKCQAQARNTAEALAEIKCPTRFIGQQTNIAHGHQQVVNNPLQAPIGAGGKSEIAQNKLLEEDRHGNTLDTRAPVKAGRADQDLEALGALYRP